MRILFLACWLVLYISFNLYAAPMEPYENYLILLVHGLGDDVQRNPSSNIFTNDIDYKQYLDPSEQKNRCGNIKGYLTGEDGYIPVNGIQAMGLKGHVFVYNFSDPNNYFWHPSQDGRLDVLSRELGDTSFDNPAGGKGKYYLRGGQNYDELTNIMVSWGLNPADCYVKPAISTPGTINDPIWLPFGIDTTNTGKGYCWIEQAKRDWAKIKYNTPSPTDSQVMSAPQKVILICHSMGGLTSRGYIVSDFYNNDVHKLVTINSPHEGSEGAAIIQWLKEKDNQKNFLEFQRNIDKGNELNSGMFAATQVIPNNTGVNLWLNYFLFCLNSYPGEGGDLVAALLNSADQQGYIALSTQSEIMKSFMHEKIKNSYFQDPIYRLICTTGILTSDLSTTKKTLPLNTTVPIAKIKINIGPLAYVLDKRFRSNFDATEKLVSVLMGYATQIAFLDNGDGVVNLYSQKAMKTDLFNEVNSNIKRSVLESDAKIELADMGIMHAAFYGTCWNIDIIGDLPIPYNVLSVKLCRDLLKTAFLPIFASAKRAESRAIMNYLDTHNQYVGYACEQEKAPGITVMEEMLYEPPVINIQDIALRDSSLINKNYLPTPLSPEAIGQVLPLKRKDSLVNVLRYNISPLTINSKPDSLVFEIDDLTPLKLKHLTVNINGYEYNMLDTAHSERMPDSSGRFRMVFRDSLSPNPFLEGYNVIRTTCINHIYQRTAQICEVNILSTPVIVFLTSPSPSIQTNNRRPVFDMAAYFPYEGLDSLKPQDTSDIKLLVNGKIMAWPESCLTRYLERRTNDTLYSQNIDTVHNNDARCESLFIYRLVFTPHDSQKLDEGINTMAFRVDPKIIVGSNRISAGMSYQYVWEIIVDTLAPVIAFADSVPPKLSSASEKQLQVVYNVQDDHALLLKRVDVDIVKK